jgi:hypothetical protein
MGRPSWPCAKHPGRREFWEHVRPFSMMFYLVHLGFSFSFGRSTKRRGWRFMSEPPLDPKHHRMRGGVKKKVFFFSVIHRVHAPCLLLFQFGDEDDRCSLGGLFVYFSTCANECGELRNRYFNNHVYFSCFRNTIGQQ